MQKETINLIIQDTEMFLSRLQYKYNIRYQRVAPNRYYGEFLTPAGDYYIIEIEIQKDRTNIQLRNQAKYVIYQKSYVTKTDVESLSKSVGVDKYIERLISKRG